MQPTRSFDYKKLKIEQGRVCLQYFKQLFKDSTNFLPEALLSSCSFILHTKIIFEGKKKKKVYILFSALCNRLVLCEDSLATVVSDCHLTEKAGQKVIRFFSNLN